MYMRTPETVAPQAPLSMGYSRQEYRRGLPFAFPGDLPSPGVEPVSPASAALTDGFFTSEPPGSPIHEDRERQRGEVTC